MGKKEKEIILQEDVEYLVVETDENNSAIIAKFDRTETPIKLADGYRIRVKFLDET